MSHEILVILLVFYLFLFLGWVAEYVIRGIALSTIASRMGKDLPWLAWIPYARAYLHGDLAGSITLKRKTITHPGIWLIVIPLAGGIVFLIWYFVFIFATAMSMIWYQDFFLNPDSLPTGMIISIIISSVFMVLAMLGYQAIFYSLKILVNNKIFGKFTTSNMAIVHSVLAIFIPMYETICLFVMRNKEFYTDSGGHVNQNPYTNPSWGQQQYGNQANYQAPPSTPQAPTFTPLVSPEIPSGVSPSAPPTTPPTPPVSPEAPTSTAPATSPVFPVSPEVPPSRSSVSGEEWS